MEAELFGVGHGAATGVEERPGVFEVAGRGTLCLTGLEHMEGSQQAALLRIVDHQTFERIGGGGSHQAEARFLATFQEPPEALIRRGLLRADLLYRLDVVRLELPTLAQRRSDVASLALHFLKAACRKAHASVPEMSRDLIHALETHPWPGNLRELAQRMEALALFEAEVVTAEMLPASFWAEPAPVEDALSRRLTLAELRDGYIRAVLARVGGNRSRAARWLGLSRKALWAHLRRTSN
jgi:DNA-binding NtrC family response regulator